ncbi:hypothetical protein PPERSA_00854 [Pseudocohnilembus persalinus]|uniref:Uncharacterized protein n=1 Tax=Pseudocohnilembus persalinus TaxID=266149 RepID=A0A0V0QEM8_PSEPJ|nr:hypothetical protein PPERSA_00854 [Pseudocohnilembus persalinus]|eukprot:KRX00627.1 hypothetical protein PPERSA_00854 [Pseudocohnilembus persalinus]
MNQSFSQSQNSYNEQSDYYKNSSSFLDNTFQDNSNQNSCISSPQKQENVNIINDQNCTWEDKNKEVFQKVQGLQQHKQYLSKEFNTVQQKNILLLAQKQSFQKSFKNLQNKAEQLIQGEKSNLIQYFDDQVLLKARKQLVNDQLMEQIEFSENNQKSSTNQKSNQRSVSFDLKAINTPNNIKCNNSSIKGISDKQTNDKTYINDPQTEKLQGLKVSFNQISMKKTEVQSQVKSIQDQNEQISFNESQKNSQKKINSSQKISERTINKDISKLPQQQMEMSFDQKENNINCSNFKNPNHQISPSKYNSNNNDKNNINKTNQIQQINELELSGFLSNPNTSTNKYNKQSNNQNKINNFVNCHNNQQNLLCKNQQFQQQYAKSNLKDLSESQNKSLISTLQMQCNEKLEHNQLTVNQNQISPSQKFLSQNDQSFQEKSVEQFHETEQNEDYSNNSISNINYNSNNNDQTCNTSVISQQTRYRSYTNNQKKIKKINYDVSQLTQKVNHLENDVLQYQNIVNQKEIQIKQLQFEKMQIQEQFMHLQNTSDQEKHFFQNKISEFENLNNQLLQLEQELNNKSDCQNCRELQKIIQEQRINLQQPCQECEKLSIKLNKTENQNQETLKNYKKLQIHSQTLQKQLTEKQQEKELIQNKKTLKINQNQKLIAPEKQQDLLKEIFELQSELKQKNQHIQQFQENLDTIFQTVIKNDQQIKKIKKQQEQQLNFTLPGIKNSQQIVVNGLDLFKENISSVLEGYSTKLTNFNQNEIYLQQMEMENQELKQEKDFLLKKLNQLQQREKVLNIR